VRVKVAVRFDDPVAVDVVVVHAEAEPDDGVPVKLYLKITSLSSLVSSNAMLGYPSSGWMSQSKFPASCTLRVCSGCGGCQDCKLKVVHDKHDERVFFCDHNGFGKIRTDAS
jgi:hypothetical protein